MLPGTDAAARTPEPTGSGRDRCSIALLRRALAAGHGHLIDHIDQIVVAEPNGLAQVRHDLQNAARQTEHMPIIAVEFTGALRSTDHQRAVRAAARIDDATTAIIDIGTAGGAELATAGIRRADALASRKIARAVGEIDAVRIGAAQIECPANVRFEYSATPPRVRIATPGIRAAGRAIRAAFARDLAECSRPGAAQLLPIAMSHATGVVAAFTMVSRTSESGIVAAVGPANIERVRTDAARASPELLAGTMHHRFRSRSRPSGGGGIRLVGGPGERHAPQSGDAAEHRTAIPRPSQGFHPRIEPPIVHFECQSLRAAPLHRIDAAFVA